MSERELKGTHLVVEMEFETLSFEETKRCIEQYCTAVNIIANEVRKRLSDFLGDTRLNISGDSLNKAIVRTYVLNRNAEDIINDFKFIKEADK